MEPLTVLAVLKFGWEVAQGIRDWCKEAEDLHESDYDKHDHVIKKAGAELQDKLQANGITVENRDIMDVLNPKIKEVVKGLKQSGGLKGK